MNDCALPSAIDHNHACGVVLGDGQVSFAHALEELPSSTLHPIWLASTRVEVHALLRLLEGHIDEERHAWHDPSSGYSVT